MVKLTLFKRKPKPKYKLKSKLKATHSGVIFLLSFMLVGCQPAEQRSMTSAFQMVSGKPVVKGTELNFPQDHGAHLEQGIEWWYVTANLQSKSGEHFGVQWTLFRTLMPTEVQSKWWDNNLYFAHFAMQHQQQHVAFERFARANQAKVETAPFNAVIDNWQLNSIEDSIKNNTVEDDFLPLNLTASQNDYQIALTLNNSPITLHGDNGYSQKTQSGHASYYYSYPFLTVDGTVTFAGQEYQVSGNAWYDREWSASLLDKSQLGWDWFSLVSEYDNKQGLMLFCIRGDKQHYDYCRGTQIESDGTATDLEQEKLQLSVLNTISLEGREYPDKWQLILPDHKQLVIETLTKDSRNKLTIPYWEGRVKVSGDFNGLGYAELTGY